MTAACHTELIEDGRALLVTLDHGADNAVTPAMLDGLAGVVDQLEATPRLCLAVLRGRDQVFSKGYDVSVIQSHSTSSEHRQELLLGNDVCSRIADCSKPWIAAISGACLGAGLELALACHFRLCTERSRLGLPELARGLLPGLGGIHRLTRLVGRARALEIIVGGVLVSGEEAGRIGLVHRVLPPSDFFNAVLSFARGILAVDNRLVQDVMKLTARAEWQGEQDCVLDTVDAVLRGASHKEAAA